MTDSYMLNYYFTRKNLKSISSVNAECTEDIPAVIETIHELEQFTMTDDDVRMAIDIFNTVHKPSVGHYRQNLYYVVRYGMLLERQRLLERASELWGADAIDQLFTEDAEDGAENEEERKLIYSGPMEELVTGERVLGNDKLILSYSEDQNNPNKITLDRLIPDDWAALIPIILKGTRPPYIFISRDEGVEDGAGGAGTENTNG